MRYPLVPAFLLLLAPWPLLAQRYGRPDGFQNFERMSSPQLLLQVNVLGKRFYFRSAALRKMRRSVVTLTDAVTGTSHRYEGVALDQLVQTAGTLETRSLKISFRSRQNETILGRELDPELKPIIADTLDGKRLTGYMPYYFVAKSLQKPLQPTPEVSCVTIGALE